MREIFYADLDDPLQKGVDILLDKRLQSLPLYSKNSKRFECFLELSEIVYFASKVMRETELIPGQPTGFLSILAADERVEKAKCRDLVHQLPGNAYLDVVEDTKLRDVLATMVKSDFILQRIPVVEKSKDRKLKGILSQSRIVHEVYNRVASMSFAEKTVKDLFGSQYERSDVISVGLHDSVKTALDLIQARRVSGLAIVNSDGRLVGNFSASDVKRYIIDLTRLISTTMESFIDTVEKPEGLSYPVSVTLSTTLEEVLAKVDMVGVHRVFVVDNSGKPIGVISTKDLVRLFLAEADGAKEELVSEDNKVASIAMIDMETS
jgi:CBS domain-containing protein